MNSITKIGLFLPIALSLSLGLSSCSSIEVIPPNISAVQTSPNEKTINENIASTMNSLATAITLDRNVKTIMNLNEEDSRKINKIWKQIDPFIEIDFNDKTIIHTMVYGEVSEAPLTDDDISKAKFQIIVELSNAFVFYDHISGDNEVISYGNLAIEYSNLINLDSGNILPQNQILTEKDDAGNIVSALYPTNFIFNADGTQILYNSDRVMQLKNEEKIMQISVNLRDAIYVVDEHIKQDNTPTKQELVGLIADNKENGSAFQSEQEILLTFDEKTHHYTLRVFDPDNKGLYMLFDSSNGFVEDSKFVQNNHSTLSNKLYLVSDALKNRTLAGIKEIQKEASEDNGFYLRNTKSIVESAKIDEKKSTVETTVDGKKFTFKIPLM